MARRPAASAAAENGAPFYERRGFQGTVAVVGLLTAIWGLSGVPSPWSLLGDLFSTDVARSNTEIVLDSSAAMAESFTKGETKLEAAVDALQAAGGRNDEGLGLRQTNPGCEFEEEPLVDVGTDHVEQVVSAAEQLHPEGKSNIIGAVLAALGEFRANPDFNRPGSVRRVLVYTAGQDDCFSGDVSERIRAELEGADVSASFTLIALNASETDLARLHGLESALESAGVASETIAADDPEQLDEANEQVSEESEEAIEAAEEEQEKEETVSG
jgi:hypothetical protein